jgi:hypothetical protein
VETAVAPASPRRPARRGPDDRPPAPWGSFPLVELTVLLGIVLLVWGFATSAPTRVVVGLILGSLGGLEISIREHFAGYRSHTLLLSGALGVGVLVLVAVAAPGFPLGAALAIAVGVFAVAAWALMGAFRRRAGVSVKLR